ncbi:MAG: AI-2E family transporter [Bacteroidia bacterium]|nr:AI-2E family transporter [Bacteroidia bacterium]
MILFILILLLYLVIKELAFFLPGLLGALTIYILSRANYFQLVYSKKWRKGLAAWIFIIYYLLLLGLPIFLLVSLMSPKINSFLNDPVSMINSAKETINLIQIKMGTRFLSEDSLSSMLKNVTAFIPTLINSTANLIANLALMLFILYYMLINGREIERYLGRIIPLKPGNITLLASETKKMVRANALGIPLISIIQGLTATLGYFIFGVKEFALWGFITGIFAFFPVIGTMVVWVPLVIIMFAGGHTWQATGLLFYSLIITGNIDYLARITLLKKMANVHPVITILGVLVGLGLFGFIGLIFGPLLVNYIIVVFDIYMNEFIEDKSISAETLATRSEEIKEKNEPQ